MKNKPNVLWKTNLLVATPRPGKEWEKLFLALFRGQLDWDAAKTLLLLLARKGEGVPEIWGCLRAVRRLEPPRHVSLPYLIDICGTGGDGKKTFNISTVSSFVIAGSGGYVAKHGNRAVSSQTGSSDLMEALGVRLDLPAHRMLDALHRYRLGYFHAPLYHPCFSALQGLRRELGIRTLFNALGPLLNPVELRYQMIGASNPQWLWPLAESLRKLKRVRGAVVRSADGLDELSTAAASDIFYVEGNKIRKLRLNPRRFGLSKPKKTDYEGGDRKTNREIALGILKNRLRGPRQDIVLLNSGFALWLTGLANSLGEGIGRSRWAIRSGRAYEVLEALQRFSRKGIHR